MKIAGVICFWHAQIKFVSLTKNARFLVSPRFFIWWINFAVG